jgi:hypothetical protein
MVLLDYNTAVVVSKVWSACLCICIEQLLRINFSKMNLVTQHGGKEKRAGMNQSIFGSSFLLVALLFFFIRALDRSSR